MSKLTRILEYLLYFFVFLLPWQTRLIYQEFFIHGQPFEYGRLSLYVTELLLELIILLGLVFIFKKTDFITTKIKKYSLKRLFFLGLGLILCAINILLAVSPTLAFYKATQLILALCFFLLLLIAPTDFKKLSWAYIYSAIIQSILALQQFSSQKIDAYVWLGISAQDPSILGTPVVLTSAGRWLRSFGAFPHPNMLAGFLVLALIIIFFLSLKSESSKDKNKLLLSFVVIFLALLTTLSRAAILGVTLIFITSLFFTAKKIEWQKKTTRWVILMFVISIFFTTSYPNLVFTRVTSNNNIEQKSNAERISQYQEWLTTFKENPLFGVGLGNYPLSLRNIKPGLESWDYQPIHNTFLLVIAEIGIIPLAYLIFVFIYYSRNRKLRFPLSVLPLLFLVFMFLFDHYWWSFYTGLMLMSFVLAFTIILWREDKNNKK